MAGIAHDPYGAWMEQVARNSTDAVDGFLKDTRYLIRDRDPLFTQRFVDILGTAGVKTVRLPARSPDLNAFAERFVLSARSECLRRMIPLGEKHLRTILPEFLVHYHTERNHQGLDNELLSQLPVNSNANGSIQCRERLGSLPAVVFLTGVTADSSDGSGCLDRLRDRLNRASFEIRSDEVLDARFRYGMHAGVQPSSGSQPTRGST